MRDLAAGAGRGGPGSSPLWTANDALAHITRPLALLPDGSTLTEFVPRIPEDAAARALRYRAALASTLFAGLEQARAGAVLLDQEAD